jgi:hypothetical protein
MRLETSIRSCHMTQVNSLARFDGPFAGRVNEFHLKDFAPAI